jgi:hypothetical protein
LTYKSIQDAVNTLEGKSLFRLRPETGETETPRTMLVSQDMSDVFDRLWPETTEGDRLAGARALLDAFTLGDFFTVGETPFDKDTDAMMARVHPVGEEAFDFRCFDCFAGVRIFGCFTDTDEFIALTWHLREDLRSSEDWDIAVAECKAEWRKLFGDLPPHSGETIDAYISYNAEFV